MVAAAVSTFAEEARPIRAQLERIRVATRSFREHIIAGAVGRVVWDGVSIGGIGRIVGTVQGLRGLPSNTTPRPGLSGSVKCVARYGQVAGCSEWGWCRRCTIINDLRPGVGLLLWWPASTRTRRPRHHRVG